MRQSCIIPQVIENLKTSERLRKKISWLPQNQGSLTIWSRPLAHGLEQFAPLVSADLQNLLELPKFCCFKCIFQQLIFFLQIVVVDANQNLDLMAPEFKRCQNLIFSHLKNQSPMKKLQSANLKDVPDILSSPSILNETEKNSVDLIAV